MKVSVKMNSHAVSTLIKAQSQALAMTGQQVLNDLRNAQTMPFDTGDMQNNQTFMDDSEVDQGTVSVVTDAPHARQLYFHPEYDFQKGKNPNAGAGWFDPYISGNKQKLVKQWYKQFVRRNGGGYIK